MELEKYAINKYPLEGKCKHSCFANGNHRAGTVPIMSLLDGGAPGYVCAVICLECEKRFKQTWFVLRNQPRKIESRLIDNAGKP